MGDHASRQDKFFKLFENLAEGSDEISLDQSGFASVCEALYLSHDKDALLHEFNKLIGAHDVVLMMSKVYDYKETCKIKGSFQVSDLPGVVRHLTGKRQNGSYVDSRLRGFCESHSGNLDFAECAEFIIHMKLHGKRKDLKIIPEDSVKFLENKEYELDTLFSSTRTCGFLGIQKYTKTHREDLQKLKRIVCLIESFGVLDTPVNNASDEGSAKLEGSAAKLSKGKLKKTLQKLKRTSENVTDKSLTSENLVGKLTDTKNISCAVETPSKMTAHGVSLQEHRLNVQTGSGFSQLSASYHADVGNDELSGIPRVMFRNPAFIDDERRYERFLSSFSDSLGCEKSLLTSIPENRAEEEKSSLAPTKVFHARPSSEEEILPLPNLIEQLCKTAQETKKIVCESRLKLVSTLIKFRPLMESAAAFKKSSPLHGNNVQNLATALRTALNDNEKDLLDLYRVVMEDFDKFIQTLQPFLG